MLEITLEQIIQAWAAHKHNQYSSDQVALRHAILQSLAKGRPISARQAAEDSGLPLEAAEKLFDNCCVSGADMDDDGNITGLALSLNPTPHRLRVNGRELYAWCALDSLFLPGLIGQTAEVESICPATGTPIHLTVSPYGIETITPAETVVSIVVPGVSAACRPGQQGGAQSPTCSSMHFFRAQEAAAKWLVAQPDVAILVVRESWQLADAVWIAQHTKWLATT